MLLSVEQGRGGALPARSDLWQRVIEGLFAEFTKEMVLSSAGQAALLPLFDFGGGDFEELIGSRFPDKTATSLSVGGGRSGVKFSMAASR